MKAKSVILFLLGMLLTIPGLSDSHAQEKTISLATLNWAPYAGEDLDQFGFTSEIITEAFKRVGYEVSITFKPWKRVLNETERGNFDGLFSAYYTEERAKKFGYSDSYGDSVLGFFARKGKNISYTTLEDLKPYKIGTTLGYANSEEFDAASYLKKSTFPSDEVSLKQLHAGRVDLSVVDKYVGYHILNTTFPEGKDSLVFLDPPLAPNKLYLCVSKAVPGWEEKIVDFNKGLEQIRNDGTYDKILKKHGF